MPIAAPCSVLFMRCRYRSGQNKSRSPEKSDYLFPSRSAVPAGQIES